VTSLPLAVSFSTCCLIHLCVKKMPSFKEMLGAQPRRSLIIVLSLFLPRTPSGPGMCLRGRSLPSIDIANAANWFIESISSVPKFNGSAHSDNMIRMLPSTQSSIYMKERVCLPSPHTSNSVVEHTALRQKAAGTFSRPPFQVPLGPYTLWYLATRHWIGKSFI